MVLKLDCLCRLPCWLYYLIATCRRSVLMTIGTIGLGLAPAFALDNANAPSPKKIQNKQFTSGQQALRVGLDDLKIGDKEDSIAALAYAAANGQILARWKLGEMYATGDSVPRDDLKAYHYFNKLVEEYDED